MRWTILVLFMQWEYPTFFISYLEPILNTIFPVKSVHLKIICFSIHMLHLVALVLPCEASGNLNTRPVFCMFQYSILSEIWTWSAFWMLLWRAESWLPNIVDQTGVFDHFVKYWSAIIPTWYKQFLTLNVRFFSWELQVNFRVQFNAKQSSKPKQDSSFRNINSTVTIKIQNIFSVLGWLLCWDFEPPLFRDKLYSFYRQFFSQRDFLPLRSTATDSSASGRWP